jgi:hypothetical protein
MAKDTLKTNCRTRRLVTGHHHRRQDIAGFLTIPKCTTRCPLCGYTPKNAAGLGLGATIRKHLVNMHTADKKKEMEGFLGVKDAEDDESDILETSDEDE